MTQKKYVFSHTIRAASLFTNEQIYRNKIYDQWPTDSLLFFNSSSFGAHEYIHIGCLVCTIHAIYKYKHRIDP